MLLWCRGYATFKISFSWIEWRFLSQNLKSIYQSCWLELHNYLTPLEQIHVINSVFYSMYKFTGFDLEANKANHYYISEVLETREGNNYSLGIIYQLLCEMLDIPVFAIQLPRQHLLAYFDNQYDFSVKMPNKSKNSVLYRCQYRYYFYAKWCGCLY